eukprot:Clim_evm29s9 gene=Clim_evmTU29s9
MSQRDGSSNYPATNRRKGIARRPSLSQATAETEFDVENASNIEASIDEMYNIRRSVSEISVLSNESERVPAPRRPTILDPNAKLFTSNENISFEGEGENGSKRMGEGDGTTDSSDGKSLQHSVSQVQKPLSGPLASLLRTNNFETIPGSPSGEHENNNPLESDAESHNRQQTSIPNQPPVQNSQNRDAQVVERVPLRDDWVEPSAPRSLARTRGHRLSKSASDITEKAMIEHAEQIFKNLTLEGGARTHRRTKSNASADARKSDAKKRAHRRNRSAGDTKLLGIQEEAIPEERSREELGDFWIQEIRKNRNETHQETKKSQGHVEIEGTVDATDDAEKTAVPEVPMDSIQSSEVESIEVDEEEPQRIGIRRSHSDGSLFRIAKEEKEAEKRRSMAMMYQFGDVSADFDEEKDDDHLDRLEDERKRLLKQEFSEALHHQAEHDEPAHTLLLPAASPQPLERIIIYETKMRQYIVGCDALEERFRILKVDRSASRRLEIHDDGMTYTKEEVVDILVMVHEGNRATGGLLKRLSAYAILGFVRFLEGFYLVCLTKRKRVASIGSHIIYSVQGSSLVPVLNDWGRSVRDPEEQRYLKSFRDVDLTQNFYFSYTYDLTNSLQWNMTSYTNFFTRECNKDPNFATRSNGPQFVPQRRTEFIWNQYFLEPFQSKVDRQWIVAIIHGYLAQARLDVLGKPVYVTVLARRNRHFAGPRFLKRGVDDSGHVANFVETEQIIHDASTLSHFGDRYTSYVLTRGSIPLFWAQDNAHMTPKRPITVTRRDPFHHSACVHFDWMFKNYGSPIVIVNLVKAKEKKPRESILHKQFGELVKYVKKFLPNDRQLQYNAFDIARCAKVESESVLDRLSEIAQQVLKETHFFCSGASDPPEYAPPTTEIQKLRKQDRNNTGESSTTSLMSGMDPSDQKQVSFDKVCRVSRKPNFAKHRQSGVPRVNCIDCLDRTNACLFMIGKHAMVLQLRALGLIAEDQDLDFDTESVQLLEEMYEEKGDTIALQYGGSQLVNTIDTYRMPAAWKAQSRDLFTNLQRYYNNSFNDAEKQIAMNVFLGVFVPNPKRPNIWAMESDYFLHYQGSAPPSSLSTKSRMNGWRKATRSYLNWLTAPLPRQVQWRPTDSLEPTLWMKHLRQHVKTHHRNIEYFYMPSILTSLRDDFWNSPSSGHVTTGRKALQHSDSVTPRKEKRQINGGSEEVGSGLSLTVSTVRERSDSGLPRRGSLAGGDFMGREMLDRKRGRAASGAVRRQQTVPSTVDAASDPFFSQNEAQRRERQGALKFEDDEIRRRLQNLAEGSAAHILTDLSLERSESQPQPDGSPPRVHIHGSEQSSSTHGIDQYTSLMLQMDPGQVMRGPWRGRLNNMSMRANQRRTLNLIPQKPLDRSEEVYEKYVSFGTAQDPLDLGGNVTSELPGNDTEDSDLESGNIRTSVPPVPKLPVPVSPEGPSSGGRRNIFGSFGRRFARGVGGGQQSGNESATTTHRSWTAVDTTISPLDSARTTASVLARREAGPEGSGTVAITPRSPTKTPRHGGNLKVSLAVSDHNGRSPSPPSPVRFSDDLTHKLSNDRIRKHHLHDSATVAGIMHESGDDYHDVDVSPRMIKGHSIAYGNSSRSMTPSPVRFTATSFDFGALEEDLRAEMDSRRLDVELQKVVGGDPSEYLKAFQWEESDCFADIGSGSQVIYGAAVNLAQTGPKLTDPDAAPGAGSGAGGGVGTSSGGKERRQYAKGSPYAVYEDYVRASNKARRKPYPRNVYHSKPGGRHAIHEKVVEGEEMTLAQRSAMMERRRKQRRKTQSKQRSTDPSKKAQVTTHDSSNRVTRHTRASATVDTRRLEAALNSAATKFQRSRSADHANRPPLRRLSL